MKKTVNKVTFFNLLLPVALLITGCAHQDKRAAQEKTIEGLKEKAVAALEHKRYDEAAGNLEKIIARYPEDANIVKYKLGLAHCYLQQQQFESAYQMYEHFTQYYPNDKNTEYAKYKAVTCRYYQTLTPDRDQTATEATIKACKEYLDNTSYTAHRNEIVALNHTCTQKLIDKEIYVFNFYFDRGNLNAAKKRLAHLKDRYGSKQDDLLPRILYLEAKVAQRSNDKALLTKSLALLSEKYDASPYTKMAQALVPETKRPFIF